MDKEDIIKKINERAKNLRCPVCSNVHMIIGDGYFAHDIQKDFTNRIMGGKNIPTIPIICSNCGLVREFSVGILGLLSKKDEK